MSIIKKLREKRYTFPLVLFLISKAFGVLVYFALEPFLAEEPLSIVMRIVLGTAFFVFTHKFLKDKKELYKFRKISKVQLGLICSLFLLFALNNYFMSHYATKTDFMSGGVIGLIVIGFIVNSFYEEFAYRGFIQSYVNENTKAVKSPISQGNIMASVLMLISHFGFFVVMDIFFAITGLLLVLVFSLCMGYIRDKGGNIYLLIVVHTMVNFIHLLMNIQHYS